MRTWGKMEGLESRQLLSAGQLDTNYGTAGIGRADYDLGNDRLVELLKVADNKLMGFSYNDGGFLQLTRFNSNGTLDTSFRSDGKEVTSFLWGTESTTRPGRVAFHPSSQRFAVAVDAPGSSWFDVAVYNPSGSLYTIFSTDGILNSTTDFQPQRIGFQSDGKLIVAGISPAISSTDPPVVVRRYNTNGTQDLTFGVAAGQTLIPSSELVNDMIVTSDGKIAILSEWSVPGKPTDQWDLQYGLELVRLTSAGKFDTNFSGDGKQVFNAALDQPTTQTPHGRDLELGANGDHYVLSDVRGRVELSHITAAGAVDFAFSSLLERPAVAVGHPVRIELDTAGNILALGSVSTATGVTHSAYICRYFPDGQRDMRFGDKGITILASVEDAFGLVVQNGQALVGGRGNVGTAGTQRDILIARLQGGAPGDYDMVLNQEGTVRVRANNIDEIIQIAIRDTDGRLIVNIDGFKRTFARSRIEKIAIYAMGGHDVVTIGKGLAAVYVDGGGGADTLNGGQYADVLFGSAGRDKIYGFDGDDRLIGGSANDYLLGGAGKDDLFGDTEIDTLSGAGGNDRLFSGPGADFVNGGDGIDAAPIDDEDTLVDTIERVIIS